MWISCLLCVKENPFPLYDYSHQVVGLKVIYISNRFFNWGQVEAFFCLLDNWDHQFSAQNVPEPDSKYHKWVNLTNDRVTEEVVTAQSNLSSQFRNLEWMLFVRYVSRIRSRLSQNVRWQLKGCRVDFVLAVIRSARINTSNSAIKWNV